MSFEPCSRCRKETRIAKGVERRDYRNVTRDATRDVTRVRFRVRIRVRGFYQVFLVSYLLLDALTGVQTEYHAGHH